MATLTHNQLNEWATQIARKIDFCEPSEFVHTFGGFEAEIKYTCDLHHSAGDYWTAPEIWPENERVEILGLWNTEDGEDRPDLMAELTKRLN